MIILFKSTNYTNAEQISLAEEIAKIGVQDTPFTSILMARGIEQANSTIYTFREKTLSHDEDISAEEGADTTKFQTTARRELNNVLEIFKKGASISGTAEAMNAGQLGQEVEDRLLELKINLEKKLINGVKDDGSTSGVRKMSGLIEFADEANTVEVTGDVTEETIKQIARKLWEQELAEGEMFALVNADIKDQIDNIYKDRYGYSHAETNFGLLVDSINTNFGKVNFALSRHVPADKIVVFNENYVNLAYLREPHFEPLAKTGDATKGQVVAEATLKLASPKGAGVVTVTA